MQNRSYQAEAWVRMHPATLRILQGYKHGKRDVFAMARQTAICAAKCTHELLHLRCGPSLDVIDVVIKAVAPDSVRVLGTCQPEKGAGGEMAALTAVSIAALTIYDQCKVDDCTMSIERVRLVRTRTGRRCSEFRLEAEQ
jgi:cyclic pyranopterin phosphate synthase